MNAQINYFLQQASQYLQAKNFDTALLLINQLLKLAPNNPDAIRMLAIVEAQRGNYPSALEFINKAISSAPRVSVAHIIKGNILHEMEKLEESILSFKMAIKHDPLNAEAYNNLGNVYQSMDRYIDSVDCYKKAIQIHPKHHFFYANLGNALLYLGKCEEALHVFEDAIKLEANDYGVWFGKANTLIELKRFNEALVAINNSLSLNNQNLDALINQAVVLIALERYRDALNILDAINEKNPNIALVWSNRGAALEGLALYGEAIQSYERATQLQPNLIDAQFNKKNARYSLACLNLRDFKFDVGWIDFEARWDSGGNSSTPVSSSRKQWSGGASSVPLYVWAEQGIGDQVLYGTMLRDLEKFPQKKIITVNQKLLPIFSRSFPNYEILAKGVDLSEDRYGEQIAMGSMGQFLRIQRSDFTAGSTPYLIDDVARTNFIKSSLDVSKDQIICGLSWRSSNSNVGNSKSMDLSNLLPILKNENINFINLQYGDVSKEIMDVEKEYGVKVGSVSEVDLYEDLDGLLSMIKSCDIVVTTSNTTAHLAGACGKETLLILPYSVGSFWYWHSIEGASIWYPSVRIFKQTQQGDWSAPIEAIKVYLEKRIGL